MIFNIFSYAYYLRILFNQICQEFCPFINWISSFIIDFTEFFIYTRNRFSVGYGSFGNIFSRSVTYLFIIVTMCFTEQKVLICWCLGYWYFFLYGLSFFAMHKNSLLTLGKKYFLLFYFILLVL